ncbi:AI-2E family transporter [Novipirellula artificiosorum]|uniref:Putative inner membrane protein n=1 Tax=Novipirellula artificiosorum TaxID=2528016 RepID=A0A5C6DAN3_9BACT|nr:AI-2E family transporter [Novipirellula artificiosorum]TWU32861.1 putative inner membrane protein [Novipirellula artificiosorum]
MTKRRSKRPTPPLPEPEKRVSENQAPPPDVKGPSADAAESNPSRSTDGQPSDAKKPLFAKLPSLSRILSVVMLLLGIVAVGALFYKVMAGFFVPLFLAALLVVIFRPVHDWIFNRIGQRKQLAAAATTLMVLSTVLMPVVVVLSVATGQFTAMVSQMNFNNLTGALDRARDQVGISLPHAEQFRRLDELTDSLDTSTLAPSTWSEINEDTSLVDFLRVLSEMLDDPQSRVQIRGKIDESIKLITFLQNEVEGPVTAAAAATTATDQLEKLRQSLNDPVVEAILDPPADAAAIASETTGEASEDEASEDEASEDEASEDEASADEFEVVEQLDAEEQFHQQSVVASAAIRSWMKTLLGGTFKSQLKLVANPSAEDFRSLLTRARESLQPRFVSLTSATGSIFLQLLIGMVVLVVAIYFFLVDGAGMIRTLMRLSPLDDNYERRLLLEFDRTSRAVVLASVLSALVQGVLAGLGFIVLGFDSVVLLFLATTLMALVPFLGAASVWVPCVVWLAMVEQRWAAALVLAIYGVVAISSIDNVIKVYVLHGRSQLHPLFALLSVLGGIKVFGPIGILVGPMVVVFLQTLLEILNHELDGNAKGNPTTDLGKSE